MLHRWLACLDLPNSFDDRLAAGRFDKECTALLHTLTQDQLYMSSRAFDEVLYCLHSIPKAIADYDSLPTRLLSTLGVKAIVRAREPAALRSTIAI